MENVELANVEGVSPEMRHRFAVDFIAVLSDVWEFL